MLKKASLMLLVGTWVCLAADISGVWKATGESPMGPIERTFVFKVEGNRLTGESESPFTGKSVIEEGKIEGDRFSFSLRLDFGGEQVKVQYEGKVVSQDELRLTVRAPMMDQTIEMVAKRAK